MYTAIKYDSALYALARRGSKLRVIQLDSKLTDIYYDMLAD